ncbi:MAG: tetratricopeptide repeat protein [Phycisphaerae bacterium]|jgi:uncharacterized protein YfaS (alpha-2-macroglobulin family)/TolA-binding protein
MWHSAKRRFIVLVALLAILPMVDVWADEPAELHIQIAMRNREYDRAAQLIDAALPAAEPEDQEYLLYRRGLALLYGGKPAEALTQFAEQIERFPEGAWTSKARFQQADAHAAMHDFEAAQQLYGKWVRELLSEGRKAAVADIYLKLADGYFSPPATLRQPDYAGARRFYEAALELEPGEALRDDLLYKRSLCSHMLDQWSNAATQYAEYLTIFDSAYRELEKQRRGRMPLVAGAAQPGKHTVAARLGLAQVLRENGQRVEARRVCQDLLALLEGLGTLNEGQRDIHRQTLYLLGQTYGMPAPEGPDELTLGVQALQQLLTAQPESRLAVQAAYDIGAAYAYHGRSEEAIAAFQALIDRKAIKPEAEKPRELAEKLSQDALFQIGQMQFNQKKYADAIGTWSGYLAKYPAGAHWSAAQQAIVNTEYQIGADAVVDERYDEAREAWTRFLEKYPLDPRTRGILFSFGQMAYTEQVRMEKKDGKVDWEAPLTHWRRLVNKYPGTEEAGQAQLAIGMVLEERVHDLEGAIAAYRQLNWSSVQAQAASRIQQMQATRLMVQTERTFRTNEPARIKVDVRNVDHLTVKLYRIDMVDYFRKSHVLGGVDRLDLVLIDPDRTIERDVTGFAPYKPITETIEIPMDGPGVYAVNVSNERATAEPPAGGPINRIEATTLVIRSDLDVVVKSSRRQMLVFAEDMLKQEPAGRVEILVSDGEKIRLEGATGDDGVWLGKAAELKDMQGLSVLAIREGHVAGNALSLADLEFSTGLEARGYLNTDRPVYRPGDAVNIRGILREVRDGVYSLPASYDDERLGWKMDVLDAKGRVLCTEALELTDFGTFATQFRVADDGPTGEYRLIVRRPDGPTFTGAFQVQSYELPKAVLRIEFDEPVVLRGKPISGHIIAEYTYGEPVVGKTVEYTLGLWSGEELKRAGVTDKEGKIAFTFDSTLFPEQDEVGMEARQAELDIHASGIALIAVQSFMAKVETLRREEVYLADEPIDVTITTLDLRGEPIKREMTLTALRRTHSRQGWAETTEQTVTVQTEEKNGQGRATLRLSKGGSYMLRAEGPDSLGHIVTAELDILISDKEDQTRLRLFSDRQHYRVGESIDLDVHSRLGETDNEQLALLTFEGEEIIGYRTLRLRPGHNNLDIPVVHEHFPNFAVGVAVMSGAAGDEPGRLHAATREFSVERELHITLKPERETYAPREELAVEVTVTDQQGQPVAAEIGLAMIDNALLSRYPDLTPEIVGFFQEGAWRRAALRTETSCIFRYQGQTRPMVTEVLSEERRLAEALGRAVSQPWESAEGRGERIRVTGEPRTNRVVINGPEQQVEQPQQAGEEMAGIPVSAGSALKPPQPSRQIQADMPQLRGVQALDLSQVQVQEQLFQSGRGQLFQSNQSTRSIMSYGHQRPRGGGAYAGFDLDLYNDSDGDGLADIKFGQFRDTTYRFAARRSVLEVMNKSQQRLCVGDAVRIRAIESELNSFLRSAPPRTFFPEVAYWNPRIVTDADGKATVRIIVPDSSTTWKLVARGVTPETLVGAGEAEVISREDFFVELFTPPIVAEGDQFQPRAAVHCLSDRKDEVRLVLTISGGTPPAPDGEDGPTPVQGAVPFRQERTLKLEGAGTYDVVFDALPAPVAGELVLELSATADNEEQLPQDAVTTEVPVRAWGMPVEAHAAGVRRDNEFVELELPPLDDGSQEYHDLQLTVAVGPSLQRWLIEEALESGPRWQYIEHQLSCSRIAPPRTHADAASGLLACLYAEDYVRARAADGEDGGADARLLSERSAGLIAQLLSAQNDDGGWAWSGKQARSDPWTTAHVAWALGKAQESGHAVAGPAREQLIAYLRKVFAEADPAQYELKATVLHGLSWLSEVDFAHVNRLHRQRQTLSNAALGRLALTFVRLDRKSAAAEVLHVLHERLRERAGDPPVRWLTNDAGSAWMESELEVTALALLAQLSVDARDSAVPGLVAYLVESARADGWRPHKARGAVLAALATYHAQGEQEAANYTVAVSVNGRERKRLSSGDSGSLRIDLGAEELGAGKQRVDFAFDGRGEYTYAVTLRGFSRTFPNPDLLDTRHVFRAWNRQVVPPPPEYDGRAVEPGFSVAREYKWFHNTARNLPVGDVASVNVGLRRWDPSASGAGDRDYLIVKETIPAGCRLLEESVRGNFLARDFTDNVLTLYYGSLEHPGDLRYRMVATTPGTYRLPPTIVQSLYRPERVHVNRSDQMLTVLSRGEKSPDEYKLSPDELYNLGKLYFEDAKYDEAAGFLEQLLAGKWVLNEEPYRESVRMLLMAALARDKAEDIVNYFEILREKYPDLIIPFEQIIKVADAYAHTGQPERAYLVYRATANASFVREAAVGGTLREEGRFLESVDFLKDLWRAYPDTPQVASTYYALAQTLYGQAEHPEAVRPRPAAEGAAPRPALTREEIIREAIALLERFLCLYPENPVADEAAYSLATAYLDLRDYWTAINRAREFIDRFAKSRWLDRFRYIEALALFHQGKFDQARELAQVVADSTYHDDQGVERPSPNKWLALYIIGQILHAENRTAEAITFYEKVRDRFADAAEAVTYFEEKRVSLPEVTIFHPRRSGGFFEADEWAREVRAAGPDAAQRPTDQLLYARPYGEPFIRLDYRNIKKAVLQVYRVDLLKLALVEKNLTEITAVNLAGIRPILEKEVELGNGCDYVDKARRVDLDVLPKDAADSDATGAGAYLVICRGDDLFASGLVLVTPLALEVQEDVGAQRARVNVVDAITRRGLSDVHLEAIGTAMSRFVSGQTDLRGVLVAEGINGYPTVVARDTAGHFAFYRSEGAVLAMAERYPQFNGPNDRGYPGSKVDYIGNLLEDNRRFQSMNSYQLEEMLQSRQKGVQVKSSQ